MTTRTIRLEKDDKSIKIETSLFGPLDDAGTNPDAAAAEVIFVERKISEGEPGGDISQPRRWIAEVDLTPGARYLLSWKMLGGLDAAVEYLLDQQDVPQAAHFKSIAKDKIPSPGTDFAHSRATPSGNFIWINSKHIWG